MVDTSNQFLKWPLNIHAVLISHLAREAMAHLQMMSLSIASLNIYIYITLAGNYTRSNAEATKHSEARRVEGDS